MIGSPLSAVGLNPDGGVLAPVRRSALIPQISSAARPHTANAPPKMMPKVFEEELALESKAIVNAPIPIPANTAGTIRIALGPPETSPPITAMKIPPMTNRIHQPVPAGQYG